MRRRAEEWRQLSLAEKTAYEVKLSKMRAEYEANIAAYLATLTEGERKLFQSLEQAKGPRREPTKPTAFLVFVAQAE